LSWVRRNSMLLKSFSQLKHFTLKILFTEI